jgi:hypothetical protein
VIELLFGPHGFIGICADNTSLPLRDLFAHWQKGYKWRRV